MGTGSAWGEGRLEHHEPAGRRRAPLVARCRGARARASRAPTCATSHIQGVSFPRPIGDLGSQHLPERTAPYARGQTQPHRLWIQRVAGGVPQHEVVSSRHSDTRKRPVRSGAPWLTRRRCSTTQALSLVYPPSKSLCFTPGGARPRLESIHHLIDADSPLEHIYSTTNHG